MTGSRISEASLCGGDFHRMVMGLPVEAGSFKDGLL